MINLQPIFWHQGLFLQPQHFQYGDENVQYKYAQIAALTSPYQWGVVSMSIDELALDTLQLRLQSIRLLMRDGSFIQYPGNAVIEARNVDLASLVQGRTAYIGIRRLVPGQENVQVLENLDQISNINTRFVSSHTTEPMADIYAGSTQADVQTMSYVLRIFWEDEIKQLEHYETMPLVRLEQDGDRARVQHQYIAPSLNISATPLLLDLLRQIRDEIAGRARQLEVFKPTSVAKTEDIDANHVSLLMALSVLNRYGPILSHLIETRQTHPWHVYGVLRQLVGELSTFSDHYDMMGMTRDGQALIPAYDHENIASGFQAIVTVIRLLLNEIAAAPEMLVRLEPAGASAGLYQADLPDGFFGPRHRYHLLVYGFEGEDQVQSLLRDLKLASPKQMELLVTHSLSGVDLLHLPEPPRGIPRRSGALYFYIDALSDAWAQVEQEQQVSLFAAGAPDGLKAELIVSKW